MEHLYQNDCPFFLKDFLFYLETIRGRSEKTVYEYYLDIRTFLRYLQAQKMGSKTDPETLVIASFSLDDLKKITLSDIYSYLHHLSSDRGNSTRTRSRKISALRGFYKYLSTKTQLGISDPLAQLDSPSIRKTVPMHLSLSESMEILEEIDGPYKTRDYCMLTLFLNCGMRLSELVGISLDDIRDNTLKLLGKGNKERIIYLNEACKNALDDYLRERPETKEKALFVSRNGGRISRRRVQQIVEENLKRCGLDQKGYSTHSLRHTAATLMYQYGDVDIRILKEILGHANIATTEMYTHVANKQMEESLSRSPLANVKRKKT